MGKRVSEKNRCITVNLHHDGVFIVSPFEYAFGDEKKITDIHFEGMSYVQVREVIVKLVHGPIVILYYCKINLYVEHRGYDALDIRDQDETTADDEVDDNVIIKNVTTNDPFLNKLCPDSAHFLNVVDEPLFANDETVVEDSENIDPKFNVKSGVTYIRHDPNQNWKKIEPVLGRDPFIPTLKMKTDIKEKFFINVSLGQWSTCRLDDEETESGHYYFRRIYVCFKSVKEGWLAGCRKGLLEGVNELLPNAEHKKSQQSSCKKEPVPKPPKVPKPPAPRIVYGTHASVRVRGRGQRVVEVLLEVGVKVVKIWVKAVQLGCHKEEGEGVTEEEVVVREEEVGVKEVGEGVREAEIGVFYSASILGEMTEDEVRKNLEHDYMEELLLQEEQKSQDYESKQDKFDQEALMLTLEEKGMHKRMDEDRLKEQMAEEEWDRKIDYYYLSNWTQEE
nr:hypothetical protein [Tanacetum cinerariifolium]